MSHFGFGALERQLDSIIQDPVVRARHKLIIGIDYGTTFSGVSYVTTDKSDIEDINIITSWPGADYTTHKTPTRIAYSRENPKLTSNQYGFGVSPKHKSYSWTKLLLDKNAIAGNFDDPALADISDEGLMRLPTFRDARGVCEDFLHEIYQHVSLKLRNQMTSATFDNTPMECWITLPAIWSEEAKVATLEAAKNAGFGNRRGDEIFTIAEPEAAAIATLKLYSRDGAFNPIKPNDHILICDCGGGTVDITTYTIKEVEPRLEFDELCVGVGGKCGSTYIDRNLHEFLFDKFGEAFDEVPLALKGPGSKFMSCFETIKRDFGVNDNQDTVELSPLKLDVEDSFSYDDEERMVMITYEEMQSLFDPVVTEIINLVSQQVREAKEKENAAIDRIILVGGFGDSAYLNKALENWCRENGQIILMCPPNPQSAVVRGAALRGLEGVTPKVKRARRHYGIALSALFEEGVDPEGKSYTDSFDGSKRCEDKMFWLISKGEKIFKDTMRNCGCCRNYTPGIASTSVMKLYSTALDVPPRYSTDPRVETVGRIVSSFPAGFNFGLKAKSRYNPALGKTVHQFAFKMQIQFGGKGENLVFQDLVDDKIISSATIEFDRH